MQKMKKKIVGAVLSVAMIFSIFAIPASAKYYSFNFSVTPANDRQVSAVNPKNDYDPAYTYTENHNIIKSDFFWYRVLCGPYTTSEPASTFVRIMPNDNGGTIAKTIEYYDDYAWPGANRYLMADTDKYSVHAEGHWWS